MVPFSGVVSPVATAAPAFFSEVVALLAASALMAYLGHRLRVMPIVSFLLAGAFIGPQALGFVQDEALIEAAAEIGVMLLLFTIGIEFSLERLSRIRRIIVVGGGVQVGLTLLVVAGLLGLFGVGWQAGLYTGFLVALSSTAIVMKLLVDRGEMSSEDGQAALGILIFQDLAVVAMVLLVPLLGGEGGSPLNVAAALGKAIGIIALVLVVARRGMPSMLEAVARTCSQEIFLLTIVAICFGTAWLTSLAGVSLSLGAFLAGLIISESRFSAMAFGEILPLQILFSATFFVSVGLLLDLRFLMAHPLLIMAVVGSVLLVKMLAAGLSLSILGYGTGTAAFTGLMLAQVGEFSFVLERTGREVGLFPAGLEDGGAQVFIAVTVVLMMATPFLTEFGRRLRRRQIMKPEPPGVSTQPAPPSRSAEASEAGRPLHDHVLIAGYGTAGRTIARALRARAIPQLILTLSPEGANEAEAEDLPVLRGNYTRRHELVRAGIQRARVLVVADDDQTVMHRVVDAARLLNPDLQVIMHVHSGNGSSIPSTPDRSPKTESASNVAGDRTPIERLLAEVLMAYDGKDAHTPTRETHRNREHHASFCPSLPTATTPSIATSPINAPTVIQLSDRQKNTRHCTHTDQAQAVVPSAEGCEECLQMGDAWVHLRICMTCGHVGCCDASKNKHATKHHGATGHPIVKSFEPGENWAWCYEDRSML